MRAQHFLYLLEKWTIRSFIAYVLFFLWLALVGATSCATGNRWKVVVDLRAIEDEIAKVEQRRPDAPVESLRDLPEDFWKRYDDRYLVVPTSAPIRQAHPDARVATKKPCFIIFPLPSAFVCYTTKKYTDDDLYWDDWDGGSPDLYIGTLTREESKQFSKWLAEFSVGLAKAEEKRLFNEYDAPFIAFWTSIAAFLLAIIAKGILVVKRERKLRRELEKLYSEFERFRSLCGRDPNSASELRSKLASEEIDCGLGTPFRFIKKLQLKYHRERVLVATWKSWLAPLWPLWGGKRRFILLADGRVVKLRGSLTIDDFQARIKVAEKRLLPSATSRTSSPFFNDGSTAERFDVDDEESRLTPALQRFLSVKKRPIFLTFPKIFLPPILLLIVPAGVALVGEIFIKGIFEAVFTWDFLVVIPQTLEKSPGLAATIASFLWFVWNSFAEY